MIKFDILFILLFQDTSIKTIKMLGRLVIPVHNMYEFILCTISAYIVTRITFPPNNPPPSFPFLFGQNENSENAQE